jgi:hypothetical protein
MRELNRFRGDFNDCYSLRSKLITTQKVSKDIGKLITMNEDLLKSEKKVLNDFKEQRHDLKESNSSINSRVQAYS